MIIGILIWLVVGFLSGIIYVNYLNKKYGKCKSKFIYYTFIILSTLGGGLSPIVQILQAKNIL